MRPTPKNNSSYSSASSWPVSWIFSIWIWLILDSGPLTHILVVAPQSAPRTHACALTPLIAPPHVFAPLAAEPSRASSALPVFRTFPSILSQTHPPHILKRVLSRSPKICLLLNTIISFQFSFQFMSQKYLTHLLLNKLISLGFQDPQLFYFILFGWWLLLNLLYCFLLFYLTSYMQWGVPGLVLGLLFSVYTMVSQLWHHWHLGPGQFTHCRDIAASLASIH